MDVRLIQRSESVSLSVEIKGSGVLYYRDNKRTDSPSLIRPPLQAAFRT
jgi:hypothetical protein